MEWIFWVWAALSIVSFVIGSIIKWVAFDDEEKMSLAGSILVLGAVAWPVLIVGWIVYWVRDSYMNVKKQWENR